MKPLQSPRACPYAEPFLLCSEHAAWRAAGGGLQQREGPCAALCVPSKVTAGGPLPFRERGKRAQNSNLRASSAFKF